MKKLFFSIFLLLCAVSVALADNPADFQGKWFLKYVSDSGVKIPADVLGLASYNIEITADKAILTGSNSSKEGTWKQNTETSIIASFPDNELEIMREEDCLTITDDGTVMYFYKSTCTCDCEALQAKIDELTARIAELENK